MKHCPTAKLTYQQVQSILERIVKGDKQKDLAAEFRVSETAISFIKYGKTYQKVRLKLNAGQTYH